MKKLRSLIIILLSGSFILGACQRDRYVCSCFSKVKGSNQYELGKMKESKAKDECQYYYIHLKTVDSSVYCQLDSPR